MIRFDSAAIQKVFPKVSPITAYYSSSKTWVFPSFFSFFCKFYRTGGGTSGIEWHPANPSLAFDFSTKKMAYSTGLN